MAQSGAQRQPRRAGEIDRAVALHRAGHFDEAAGIYRSILAATPDQPDALNLLGLLRHQQHRNIEALHLIGAALERAAKSTDIVNNLALVLAALGRHEEALAHFERALAIDGGHVNALNGRAGMLAQLQRHEEALAAYQRLLAVQPGHLSALNESGGLNMRLGRPEAALACYDQALAIAPAVELHVNKGTALRAMNRDGEALASFAAAVALRPDSAEAHWHASLVRLRHGDFAAGWRDYEWRWHKADWAGRRRNFSAPLWLGKQPVEGRTILLHAEQGLGDTIQFVRYAPLLAALGAKVLLAVQPQLKMLMRSIPGVSAVFGDGEVLSHFDLHCPLLSLPLAFATELATVPAKIPYLGPYRDRINAWRPRLPERGRLRIGLCWAGNPGHLNDRNRSLQLERLTQLLSISGLDFVSLQKDVVEADAAILRAHGVVELGRELTDFADTAAVLAMLDLIITVDTSVAHLAGAMGKAVALLLPFSPDFRWLLDRTDSPWYPSMRLFRQAAIGDWSAPFAQLRQELEELAHRPAKPR